MPEREPDEKIHVELGRNLSYLTTKNIVLHNRKTRANRELHAEEIKTTWDLPVGTQVDFEKIKITWNIPVGTRIYFEEVVTNKLVPDYYYFVFCSEGKKFGLTPRQARESIDWNSKQERKAVKDVPYIYHI